MNFEPFPYLKTERLLLRKLEFEDQNMIKILRSHPEVNRYIKRDPPSMDEAIQFIERIHSGLREGISVLWVISDKQSEQFMGTLCLWNFSEDGKTGEVGYDLLPEFQGNGIMSEAITSILTYGFNELKLERIEAYTHFENKASLNLLAKFGFDPDMGKQDPENPNNRIYFLLNTP